MKFLDKVRTFLGNKPHTDKEKAIDLAILALAHWKRSGEEKPFRIIVEDSGFYVEMGKMV